MAGDVICPRCSAADNHPSKHFHVADIFMKLLMFRAFRCEICFKRFYVFRWANFVD